MLREKLKKILNNDKLPQNINNYDFALELMDNIGSTDPELRDDLVLTVLWKMILNYDSLKTNELKALLDVCISENHLYKNIGQAGDDVFNRTFTMLMIAVIICYDNEKKEILSQEEFNYIFDSTIKYAKNEKDVRGYIDKKGWAHSTAHTADAFVELVLSRYITKEMALEILTIIKDKICIDNYTYINEEDERLIIAVITIVEKNLVDEKDIINWIKSFKDINIPDKYPEKGHLLVNRKNFLRSLYFRMVKKQMNEKYINIVFSIINETDSYAN
ncbi:DUF2785 domain-containing protein [Abyssisolibacter fermentans]|uniref:DUF2785 domain-containing protein n=1 Tax=Abyssisolibacter fermentans TaxID=1766203 RepID=UPI0008346378|nr:DUF2785 domain-containing protein [Abyssisolibacter fermentans]